MEAEESTRNELAEFGEEAFMAVKSFSIMTASFLSIFKKEGGNGRMKQGDSLFVESDCKNRNLVICFDRRGQGLVCDKEYKFNLINKHVLVHCDNLTLFYSSKL